MIYIFLHVEIQEKITLKQPFLASMAIFIYCQLFRFVSAIEHSSPKNCFFS